MSNEHTAAQPLDLDKLEALAKAATRGPWKRSEHLNGQFWHISSEYTIDGQPCKSGRQAIGAIHGESKHGAPKYAAMFEANASFIAAANPATILALIAQARTARLDTTSSAGERAAFEVWATTTGPWAECFLNLMWEAWQARATLAPVAAQQIDLDQLRELLSDALKWVAGETCKQRIQSALALIAKTTASQSPLLKTLNSPVRLDAYARQLAMSVWQTHYRTESPNFELLDDTHGVLTQLGNMLTGLVRAPVSAQQAAVVAPAEQAVDVSKLQRYGMDVEWEYHSIYPRAWGEFVKLAEVQALLAASPASTPEASQQGDYKKDK